MARKPGIPDPERGARLKFARRNPTTQSGKFTLQGLADALGRDISTVSNWEAGRAIPDSDLRAISMVTGIDFEWLKTGEGSRPDERLMATLTPERIREIRERCDMSVGTFAATIGVGRRTLQYWEAGVSKPKASQAEQILSMDRTIGEIIEDVGRRRREPPRLDLLSEAVAYIRRLNGEQYDQLHTALEGILRHARGEAVPELLDYAAIVNAHLLQLQLREGAQKSGSDTR